VVLREVADVSRFGAVRLQGERIVSFGEKAASGPGLINAGIYRLAMQTFSRFPLPEVFSLEADFFQKHLAALNLSGHVCQGDFIDIGVPEEFDRAQQLIPAWHRR
jgi:D-glycero-alpha-D-manno-heptose 1-phosphate guanylyltransferase